MAHTNFTDKPEAVLHLSELDIALVQALCRHWMVVIEQQEKDIVIQLYNKV